MSKPILVEIVGDSSSIERALSKAGVAVNTFGSKANRIGRGLKSTGSSLTRNLTFPIIGAGIAAGKLALDFNTAMTHVQALTGASQKQTQQWSNEILRLAPTVAQTPQQLADALYFVASSGAKVNQVLPITIASAKAAAAGMGDAQTVAQLLTSAMNAYGTKALSASKATDILTQAVKLGKAEPADLAQNLGRVIPIAQNMGVKFSEAAGLVAELTNTGLDAAEAVTAVRATMTSLIKPTKGAQDALKGVGLSIQGVQREVAHRGLNATLVDLVHRFHDNRSELAKLFPNVRALTGVLALTGKNAGNVKRALDQMNHSTGAATRAFNIAKKSPGFKLHQDLAKLEAVGIKLGNIVIPLFTRVATAASKVAGAFAKLSPTEQNIVLIGLAAAAAAGPIARLAGNMILLGGGIGKLARVLAGSSAAGEMAGLGTATEGAGAAAADAAGVSGFGAVSLALIPLTAAVGGLAYLWLTNKKSADALAPTYHNLGKAIKSLPGTYHSMKSAISAAAQAEQHANQVAKRTPDNINAISKAVAQQEKALRAADHQQHAYHRQMQTLQNTTRNLIGVDNHQVATLTNVSNHYKGTRAAGLALEQAHQGISSATQNLIGKLVGAADKAGALATKMRHSDPTLAATARHTQAVADAAAIVASNINKIPTFRQIRIQMTVDEQINQFARYLPPVGRPGPGQHRAAGGPVMPGNSYLVGERGPELYQPEAAGRIVPNHSLRSMAAPARPMTIILQVGKRELARALVDVNKDYTRHNGRGLLVTPTPS